MKVVAEGINFDIVEIDETLEDDQGGGPYDVKVYMACDGGHECCQA